MKVLNSAKETGNIAFGVALFAGNNGATVNTDAVFGDMVEPGSVVVGLVIDGVADASMARTMRFSATPCFKTQTATNPVAGEAVNLATVIG